MNRHFLSFFFYLFEIWRVPGEWGVSDAGFGGAPVGVPGCTPVAGGFTAGTPWGTAGAKKYFSKLIKLF